MSPPRLSAFWKDDRMGDETRDVRAEAVQMSRDLVEFIDREQQLSDLVLGHVEAAHRFYEESEGLDPVADSTARETCLNLAYAYSILARRAAGQLENGGT